MRSRRTCEIGGEENRTKRLRPSLRGHRQFASLGFLQEGGVYDGGKPLVENRPAAFKKRSIDPRGDFWGVSSFRQGRERIHAEQLLADNIRTQKDGAGQGR